MADYKILTSRNSQTLEKEVKKYLGKGWKLHGALEVNSDRYGKHYAQAITKE